MLGIYSTKKISFIICSTVLCILLWYTVSKVNLPSKLIFLWEKITSNNAKAFVIISAISLVPFIGDGISVGEDIAGQVKSSFQWVNGKTVAPNIISAPNRQDLSGDQSNWSLRPPAAALLPVIGMLFDLSLGHSIQISLIVISIIGGLGWLNVFKEFKISKYINFIVSIVLGLKTVPVATLFGTANILLYAIVPWCILYIVKINCYSTRSKLHFTDYVQLAVFLFLLGCFAWIKLSGIIVAGTIGASLYFILLKQMNNSQKLKFTILYGILGISFWIPFLILEKTNVLLTGISANELYTDIVNYEIENRLFGHNWCESTQNLWLIWSFIAAIGYSLPIKIIAHGLKDFFVQFEEFTTWTFQNSINEHVLICGLIGIVFSILFIVKFKVSSSFFNSKQRVIIICFFVLPFVGLAILSFRYEWNYLLYHMHTYEFWLIFCIPVFTSYCNEIKTKLTTILSLAIILALPITENLSKLTTKYLSNKYTYKSTTEKERGLSSSRFSQAIDYIENDSTNNLDVIYFLPSGNMGDLLLRTKMRTMATHFAGTNFPHLETFKTNQELSVYLAFNENLSKIPDFLQAISNKFPNSLQEKTILKGSIIVKKIKLVPTLTAP